MKKAVCARLIKRARRDTQIINNACRHAPMLSAAGKGAGAINGIDNKEFFACQARPIITLLFREPAIARPLRQKSLMQKFVDGQINTRDFRSIALMLNLKAASMHGQSHVARFPHGLDQKLSVLQASCFQ